MGVEALSRCTVVTGSRSRQIDDLVWIVQKMSRHFHV
jgi:hypothetical protein